MVSKQIIQELCDIHWHADERIEVGAVYEQRIAVDGGTWKKLQWCEECNKTERTIDDTLRLFRDLGVVEPSFRTPKPNANRGKKHPKNFHCPHCGREYARKPSFDSHVAAHTGADQELPYRCKIPDCPGQKDGSPAWFATPQQLGSHMNSARHRQDRQKAS